MASCILVLNAGSSSIKFAVHDAAAPFGRRAHGAIEGIGAEPHLSAHGADGHTIERRWPGAGLDHHGALRELLNLAPEIVSGLQIVAVGHRVVHGGVTFTGPVRVDGKVLTALDALVPLAPLHQPHAIEAIRAAMDLAPHVAQVACFDTAFHHRQPHLARAFALPRALSDKGIRRYGFHGLSYEYIVSQLPRLDPALPGARIIVGHLGNGASLCAIDAGASMSTTMGFSAADGLVMGTRCGAIDPGVLIHLMDTEGMDARALERLIYEQSGLLGVSGIASDMRTLRASPDPRAREAIDLFVYRIVREIGSLTASLGGLDALIFTGGIGEHDAATRSEVVAGCGWLGLAVDAARNGSGTERISPTGSRVSVWAVPTDEEAMIARHTADVLAKG
jgi:acetate kinase